MPLSKAVLILRCLKNCVFCLCCKLLANINISGLFGDFYHCNDLEKSPKFSLNKKFNNLNLREIYQVMILSEGILLISDIF